MFGRAEEYPLVVVVDVVFAAIFVQAVLHFRSRQGLQNIHRVEQPPKRSAKPRSNCLFVASAESPARIQFTDEILHRHRLWSCCERKN